MGQNPFLPGAQPTGDGELVPLEQYIDFLKDNRRNAAARSYRMALRPFGRWLAQKGRTLDTFTQNDVETFRRQIENANSSNMFFYAIRGYARYRTGALDFGDPRVVSEMQRANQLKLLRPEKPIPNDSKKYLTSEELKKFLKKVYQDTQDEVLYSACVCQFYFGARPIELSYHLRSGDHAAKINWKDNEMMLYTAKRGVMRYLAWHDDISPYLETWYEALPVDLPGEWLTRRIRKYTGGGVRLRAYTGRYSLQTHLRKARVDDMLIDNIMGHVSSSPVADIYTSFDAFQDDIRQIMTDSHYMIVDGVI
ncbi:MAG: site-specific integrase [Sphaerochaeta sp.]